MIKVILSLWRLSIKRKWRYSDVTVHMICFILYYHGFYMNFNWWKYGSIIIYFKRPQIKYKIVTYIIFYKPQKTNPTDPLDDQSILQANTMLTLSYMYICKFKVSKCIATAIANNKKIIKMYSKEHVLSTFYTVVCICALQ